MKAKSGFTLVEILIVVVILGILAAIVIPQFTSASVDAKESALVSDLQAMRSQIELYKIHHNDALPGTQSGNDFTTAMTSTTDQDGVVGTGVTFRFGPYMREIPINPFNDFSNVTAGATKLAAGTTDTAWHFVTSGADAGLFQPADDKSNPVTLQAHIDY
ncbi:MAG: type II secretion system protein [Planctomycetota bacterium]|jgi:type II secretion system protein G